MIILSRLNTPRNGIKGKIICSRGVDPLSLFIKKKRMDSSESKDVRFKEQEEIYIATHMNVLDKSFPFVVT